MYDSLTIKRQRNYLGYRVLGMGFFGYVYQITPDIVVYSISNSYSLYKAK